MKKKVLDDVGAVRELYGYLRSHVSVTNRGWANLLWRRYQGESRTTFLVTAKGEAIHLPYERAALLAEMRLLLIQQGYPPKFVALFDRTDV